MPKTPAETASADKSMSKTPVVQLALLESSELLGRLLELAKCIRIDPHSGDLTLQRGDARITLKENGQVRIQGRSIVQVSEEDVTVSAAYIDLN